LAGSDLQKTVIIRTLNRKNTEAAAAAEETAETATAAAAS
jgi:hypothetical protein